MNLLAFIVLSATKATLRDGSQTVCSNTPHESTPSRVNVSGWGSILMPYNIGPFALECPVCRSLGLYRC